MAIARDERPDLIVLDLMLPEVDGLEVCKILRRDAATASIPVIMLTARAAEMDRVLGPRARRRRLRDEALQPAGARHPHPKQLTRSRGRATSREATCGSARSRSTCRATWSRWAKGITLTATEFRLLEILARRRGRVQSRDRLLQDVWGYENPIDSRTVDTHMRRLREKLGDAAQHLETVRGVGYRFAAEE
jgi:DNA-binding response OmpR family regulator